MKIVEQTLPSAYMDENPYPSMIKIREEENNYVYDRWKRRREK